ncbi:MAG: transporter substrate-binding protein [Rubritepida sp.]|nr:transporter substrate-binding protein [Rubritepida sp.]
MRRRHLLSAASLAAASPRIARSQNARLLRFIPQSDPTGLDPVQTTMAVALVHGYMIFDTLYGRDAQGLMQPQMVEGHVVEADGLRWTLTLREGLRFHDGTPVLARDCVQSIRRWGQRDVFGSALMAVLDELSAPDDRRIVFRLRRPFPLLPEALGKNATTMLPIMPERLALTDSARQVPEMVGSGPFRFLANERVVGSHAAYARFEGYVPRQDPPSALAGAKIAHFDRVEWKIISDPATAANALQAGEVDWVDGVLNDLEPRMRRNRNLTLAYAEDASLAVLRFNHLHPPFDNPAIRRALLGAVDQRSFMTACAGGNPQAWRDGVGAFLKGAPMANDVGIEVLTGPRDLDKVRRDLAAAGYRGEKVVVLNAADFPVISAMTEVGADMMRSVGMNVDLQSLDWGTTLQRRAKREPVEQGGWSVFCTGLTGTNTFDPAGHLGLRGNGTAPGSWFGWPTSPRLEELRDAWLATADESSRLALGRDIQAALWQDVPFLPLGQYLRLGAWRRELQGMSPTMPLFFNLRWS